MLHGSGQLLQAEHKAAISGYRDDGPIWIRHLDPECGRKSVAERALISRGDERTRLINGEAIPGRKAHLRHLVHEEAVARQYCADRLQIGELRLNLLDVSQCLSLCPPNAFATLGTARNVETSYSKNELAHGVACVCDDLDVRR